MRERLREADGVDADEVVMGPDAARRRGLAGATTVFPAREPRARAARW